jgi:exodeoxyribonuclease III
MITVATWNINSVKARLHHVLNWLETNKPDFLFLQEIKCTTDTFPADALKEVGYHSSVQGQPAYHGVATLSREPVTIKAKALPGDDSDVLARFIDVAWNDWRLINIYAPNGNPLGTEKFQYKLQWLDRLHIYLQELLNNGQKFVIGGDFNIIPEAFDSRHPEQWMHDALFQPESRRKWRALQHMGLIDAFRMLHPTDHQAYTFWDYQAGAWQQDNGIRIDHFLVSPKAADQLVSCRIDKTPRAQEKPSDHTPVIIQFD